MKTVRARVIVEGRVQGVFFRVETTRTAKRLELTGWVKNLPNGTVEALFEGDEAPVKEAVAWCNKGPMGARVDNVQVSFEDAPDGSKGGVEGVAGEFTIRY
jgi:acylphosphatase